MNTEISNEPKKNVQKKATSNSKSPYTESWVKIRGIKDGMIFLPSKEMISGVKIEPRNIFIMEQNQQDNIINALKNCYNTFNFEFWLIAADRPVDISVYLSQLELMSNKVNDPAIRKLVLQDIDKANMFINNQVVDTEYYILTKEKNLDMLNQKIRSMINGLASCSLSASQTSDDDLRVILDNFLNGGVRTDFGTVVLK